MVMLTRWYWSPRERGGDCHHFSVPSIACWIEWFLEDTLGSQWSQESPRISSFPATVANLQNNSGSLTSSPHVEVAWIFLPWAMLIAGGLSLCPWPDFGVRLITIRMACRMVTASFFIVENCHTLHNHLTIDWRSEVTHGDTTQTSLCGETPRGSNYLGRGVRRIPGFPAIAIQASQQNDNGISLPQKGNKKAENTWRNFYFTVADEPLGMARFRRPFSVIPGLSPIFLVFRSPLTILSFCGLSTIAVFSRKRFVFNVFLIFHTYLFREHS